jgi:hypothetical protein
VTDDRIEAVLAEGHPIASVLVQRGGWLRSDRVELRCIPQDNSYAIWAVDLMTEDEYEKPWHTFYTTADIIIGISVRRTPA